MLGPAARPADHAGLAVLSLAECLELIASQPVGRMAFARDGDMEVLPVNHCMVGQTVALRTAGAKFTAAFWGSLVAFEVDSHDARRRTGWSVLVKGRAERVTDDVMLARLEGTGLRTWSPSAPRTEWVVIHAGEVSGRRP
jgi:nitroimidazol reductase NimA-like FMN-containing flavoprotein (pyridoxamine 5'-phosphate oxidase superfamily)